MIRTVLAATVCLLLVAAAAPPTTAPEKREPVFEKVQLAGEAYELEVAADLESRNLGLQGRTEIEDHRGMLFIHPRPRLLSYWMIDCVIDIDIVFVNDRGRVVAVHEMKAEPRREGESQGAYNRRLRRYTSRRLAQFAVELKSGEIERLGVEVGDVVELDIPRLKKMAR